MDFIRAQLTQHSKKTFLFMGEKEYSYGDFQDRIDHWQKKIKALGIDPGNCISFLGDYTLEALSLLIALLINKNIVVPLSSSMTEDKNTLFREACVQGYFSSNDNHTFKYTSLPESNTHPLLEQLRDNKESGIIIFTSGSSGKPKAALLQTSYLFDRYARKNKHYPYRMLVFLKIDHIGGINTAFAAIMTGGSIVSSPGRSPEDVCATIAKHKVQLLPTTPTFLNMLLISGMHEKYDLSSLQLITYGAEIMPTSTLQSVHKLFPTVRLKQTYGLTELGIFPTQSKDTSSTWMKVGGQGVEWKVMDAVLWIRSSMAMKGYLNAPSPFDEEGWYNTGDRVDVDGEYLRILGREREIINVGGEKVYPAEVENVLLQLANIDEVTVKGKKNSITGFIVTATCVLKEPEDAVALRKRAITHCQKHLEAYKVPAIIIIAEKAQVSDRYKKVRQVS